jgi:predicted PurR-regulated permease PerM
MSHAPPPERTEVAGPTAPASAAPDGGRAEGARAEGATAQRRLGTPPVHIERRRRAMAWGSRDILRATLLVFGVYIALRLLWLANHLFFAVFLGILFGLALERGVDILARWRIPRGLGAAAIALAFLGALAGTGALIAPTVREQGMELRNRLPDAIEKIEEWVARGQAGFLGFLGGGTATEGERRGTAEGGQDTAGAATGTTGAAAGAAAPQAGGAAGAEAAPDTSEAPAPSLGAQVGERLGGMTSYLFPFLQSTVSAFAGIILVFFIAIYIGISPQTYHGGLVRLFPKRDREKAGEVLSITATVLRRWLVTQLIAMVVIGVVTTVALSLLDVRAAFALGVLAGLLEFVPTIGPLLSALPAIAMGLLDSPEKAVIVALLYVGIQFAENHLLIPMLMSEGLDIPPALTIVAQALMALVFGFLGLLVAVPLVAAALVPIKLLYVRGVLGDEDVEVLGDEEKDDD